MGYWNQQQECMNREEIRQVQLERLQSTLNRVYKNVAHYQKSFSSIDFIPEDLQSLDDLKRLPFVTRRDLVRNYPYGMFAVPLREVVRLHAPVVNPDEPMVMGFTRNDLKNWAELIARSLTAAGLDKDDVIQVSPAFGIMTGSFGVQMGAEKIGASVIPMTEGKYPAQVKIMRDFRTSALVATPTFARGMVGAMREMNLDAHAFSLKYAILGSEPWPESLRTDLEEALHVTALDVFSLPEVFGPGAAWECPERNGLHIAEDHFIPEIIDPSDGSPAADGEEGELVITTITKEAFPLIRFRTGEITRLEDAPCACGRTHCRLSRLYKRCDEAVVLRGTRLVPELVGKMLTEAVGSEPVYQLVIEPGTDQDNLTVLIAVSDQIFFDEMRKQREFVDRLHQKISEALGWEAAVRLVEPGAFDGKRRILDQRRFENE